MVNSKIKFEIRDDCVDVYIPLISSGKFRCKTRNNFQEYGKGFAPKSTAIPENAYLEWQIGYDMVVGSDKKETSLTNLVFTGANGKKKIRMNYLKFFIFYVRLN